jgi:hypothetical protein
MKSIYFSGLILICTVFTSSGQEKLPYYEIPEAPETFTAGTTVGRMVDGLGFRFYWATEGLRPEDLSFKPSEEARTSLETIQHIHGLTMVILNSVIKEPNGGKKLPEMTFGELRRHTLESLQKASEILKNSKDISEFKIIFKRGESSSEFPFWNQINGPISDAIWHVGQVISFRRSSGNPYNSKASVFSGKVRE